MDHALRKKYLLAHRQASLRYLYRRKAPEWLEGHVVDLEARRRVALEVLREVSNADAVRTS